MSAHKKSLQSKDLKQSLRQLRCLRGFTLVELLVTISIISILSVIGITIFSSAQNSARNAKVQGDFNAIYKNIEIARSTQQKSLWQITGSNCSDCGCRGSFPTDPNACVQRMTEQYIKITPAPMPMDPWGRTYVFDENEGEGVGCRQDEIRTVGPDHTYGTSDDKYFNIPLSGYVSC